LYESVDILKYFLKYLKNGFSCIPIRGKIYTIGSTDEERNKNSKLPLISSWLEYQKRLPTEDEVKEWVKKWPLSNIAIITGFISGIVVVDFDSKEAIEWGKEKQLLDTYLVYTGRGIHAYYKYPKDKHIKNVVGFNGHKIDIRSNGGYVIAPPSIHYNNNKYIWVRNSNRIVPFPEIFQDVQNKTEEINLNLKEFYKGVKQGARNDTLARLCGSWVNDGLTLEECMEAAFIWNQRNDPPLSTLEIERTVKSIFQRHRMHDIKTCRVFYEKNLFNFPLAVYDKKRLLNNSSIVFTEIDKEKTNTKWIISPSFVWGLPTPFDDLILTTITYFLYQKTKPIKNPVYIGKIVDIAKTIEYQCNSKTILEIKNSLERIKGLTVMSKHVNKEKKIFEMDSFNIFDRIIIKGNISNTTENYGSVYIWFNNVYLKNINNSNNFIDFEIFKTIKNDIARGIFKFIFFLKSVINETHIIKISYKKLVNKLQLEHKKTFEEIQKQFEKPFEELKKLEIFKDIKINETKNNCIFEFYFY